MEKNPLVWRESTLAEMMSDLKSRLGFVNQGTSSKLVDPLLKSFLKEAQYTVYLDLGGPMARKRTEIKLVPGSKLYDFHNDIEDQDIDPQSIDSIEVYETETSVIPLRQGINEQMRAQSVERSTPRFYDNTNGQIEVLPIPDCEYRMVVHYREGPARLEQDYDRPSVPSNLVFLYALASAKAHYQHPDAQTAGQIYKENLRKVRQRSHENRRYVVGGVQQDTRYFVKRTPDGRHVL